MKSFFITAFAAGALFMSSPSPSQADESQRGHKIVFELTSDEPGSWEGVLNNVENARKTLGEKNTSVEVVAHGEGLQFLQKKENTKLAERMKKLSQDKVTFAACENTMKRKKVERAELFEFATPVDSGVAEVVRKQESGWSYLRTAP